MRLPEHRPAVHHGLGLGRGLDTGLEMVPEPPLTPALAFRSFSLATGFDLSFGFFSMGYWDVN